MWVIIDSWRCSKVSVCSDARLALGRLCLLEVCFNLDLKPAPDAPWPEQLHAAEPFPSLFSLFLSFQELGHRSWNHRSQHRVELGLLLLLEVEKPGLVLLEKPLGWCSWRRKWFMIYLKWFMSFKSFLQICSLMNPNGWIWRSLRPFPAWRILWFHDLPIKSLRSLQIHWKGLRLEMKTPKLLVQRLK